MNDLGKATAYIALFSEIGFVLLIVVLAGVLGGYWLDQQLGTVPVFVLVGFALGTAGGATACWRLIARFLARLDETDHEGRHDGSGGAVH
jgi:ATP synthase protein I